MYIDLTFVTVTAPFVIIVIIGVVIVLNTHG